MPSIFSSLNIGYSGLSAAQLAVDTTSHNITNAQSEGYVRQRVVTAAATPVVMAPGNVGNGTSVLDIERVFDNFVFDRFTEVSADKEYADFTEQTLRELSTYFPEVDDIGVKADLKEYYSMWQTFADNPDNDAIKLALAKSAETLSKSIRETQNHITALQTSLNDQLPVAIREVNTLAEKLAGINREIEIAESGGAYTANDLRDQRNSIEESLAKLIGAQTHLEEIDSTTRSSGTTNEAFESYTLSINGFNIVDGATFHPIYISNDKSANEFYTLSYERQDGSLIPMNERITGGRVGAILDLRGDRIVDTTAGVPDNGLLQEVVNRMDAFANGLIESANNIYAASSTQRMESNSFVYIDSTDAILNSGLNVKEGAFEVVIYNIDGDEIARRAININAATAMSGAAGTNSIEGQLLNAQDDNGDGSATNDVDDFVQFKWASYANGTAGVELVMDGVKASSGYTFSIEDKLTTGSYSSGSNFAGALGLNRFFDGTKAQDMNLHFELRENPTTIRAGKTSTAGDSSIALEMVQQQFEKYDFQVGSEVYNSTIYGMYDVIATDVGVETNAAILHAQSVSAKYAAVELEYSSVSKVSIDEELTNLIRYQTSYGAASKIITTIDQMMETLLGLKS